MNILVIFIILEHFFSKVPKIRGKLIYRNIVA